MSYIEFKSSSQKVDLGMRTIRIRTKPPMLIQARSSSPAMPVRLQMGMRVSTAKPPTTAKQLTHPDAITDRNLDASTPTQTLRSQLCVTITCACNRRFGWNGYNMIQWLDRANWVGIPGGAKAKDGRMNDCLDASLCALLQAPARYIQLPNKETHPCHTCR